MQPDHAQTPESEDLPLFELVQLVVIHHDGDLFPFYAVELCELAENVCSQITLKLPDDDRNGAEYPVEYVNPAAFPLSSPP